MLCRDGLRPEQPAATFAVDQIACTPQRREVLRPVVARGRRKVVDGRQSRHAGGFQLALRECVAEQ